MKKLLILMSLAFVTIAPLAIVGLAQPAGAVTIGPEAEEKCVKRFLTFPAWFRGLAQIDDSGNCGIIAPNDPSLGAEEDGRFAVFVWRIVLNIIEIATQVVGYIAFFFIIYGGFQYMTGGANPGQIESARKTIMNATIGFAISLVAVGLVNLVFGIIG